MPTTKKQHMIDDLMAKMASGEYPPGAKLPSGTNLCQIYDVSRMTVREAVAWLKATGRVTTIPGAGVYVADH